MTPTRPVIPLDMTESADACLNPVKAASKTSCSSDKTNCCSAGREGKKSTCCGEGIEDRVECCGGQNEKAICADLVNAGCDDGKNSSGCCDSGEKAPCCNNGENQAFACDGLKTKGIGCCDTEDIIKPPCCGSGDDDEDCCGKENRESCVQQEKASDDRESSNDDFTCMCCINVLINEPGLRVSDSTVIPNSPSLDQGSISSRNPLVGFAVSSAVNNAADNSIAYLEEYTGKLRSCCQALMQYCSRRACCFQSLPSEAKKNTSSPVVSLEHSRLPQPEKVNVKADIKAVEDEIVVSHGEKLQLEVRGMDCVDCVPKVGRALAQLPSVASVNLDYFSGTAELLYDPELLTPAAIASYVARATGFGVKALTQASKSSAAGIITLPISFATIPPPEALDGFDTHRGANSQVIELSFPAGIDSPHRPREILEKLKPYGAALVASDFEARLHDMATLDLIVVSLRTIACAVLSIPVLVLAWANLPNRPVLYGGIALGLTTIIQGLAFPLFSTAFRSIIYLHQADMSVLVSISTLTAYVFSVVAYAFQVAGRPFASPFFETNTLLVTLIFVGRTISAITRRSTGSALRELQRLQPNDVLLLSGSIPEKSVTPPSSQVQSLDARLLHYGDIIRIPPDTRIATDGLVIRGSSDADESSVTGESVAVSKQVGSRVIAGTLNLGGTLDVQVTNLVHENSLARIMGLVRQASASRSPMQDLSDRLSAVILPVATASACIAFLVWALVGRYVLHSSPTEAAVNALTYAIAILIVSCPCAIGLAVPTVMSVAIRLGIREGVLFRSADTLQTAPNIDVVAFDKTGTLTQGNFTMERAEILVEGAEQLIHALVKDNKHPISQGVSRYLTARMPASELLALQQQRGGAITDIVSLPGKGIKGSVCGFPLLGGNPTFTGACTHPLCSDLQVSGLTLFTVTLAGQPIAFFGLADTPRPGVHDLVAELTRRGKDVIILSGDTPSAVQHLATAVNIPHEKAYAGYTPEDKDSAIALLQANGRRVAFIGDGTNDGPALSRADVALAMAAGSDVALTTAGGVLLGSDLRRGVLALLDIASAAHAHARWALAWCVLYNVFAVLLASGVFIKFRVEPRWAGIGEVVSIVPVVAIAFGLDVRWAWTW